MNLTHNILNLDLTAKKINDISYQSPCRVLAKKNNYTIKNFISPSACYIQFKFIQRPTKH